MRSTQFDWRWVVLIIVVAMVVNAQSLPKPILALMLAGSGGYVLHYGWNVWKKQSFLRGESPRVTSWRGQRIELDDPSRMGKKALPPWRAIVPALVYFLIGGALVLASINLII